MAKLSATQKQFLVDATTAYHESLSESPAAEFLENRGLMAPSILSEVSKFRLGFVNDPLPGHEPYRGMLAIPYLRWSPTAGWSVVTMRFRCLIGGCDHTGHIGGKYVSMPGHSPRMFNAKDLLQETDTIAICEGEIDAITAVACGVPAVGIPGVECWKPHFRDPFLGYEKVFVLADGDEAGLKFAAFLGERLPNAVILPSKKGEDVNSTVLKFGKRALLERISK